MTYAYNNAQPYQVFGALILCAASFEYLQRFSPAIFFGIGPWADRT